MPDLMKMRKLFIIKYYFLSKSASNNISYCYSTDYAHKMKNLGWENRFFYPNSACHEENNEIQHKWIS